MQKVLGCFQGWLAYSEEPMEDLAGEREVKMGELRTRDLNTVPLRQNKSKRKSHENFHFREKTGIKIVGKEGDIQECRECHRSLPLTAFTTKTPRSDGAYYLKKLCRECHTILNEEQREARKNAPPKPDDCANCHKNEKLQVDHVHGSTTFRGWLCRNCNTGLGALGDNLEGVLQAAVYLEKDKSKIIEVLNGIKNE